MQRPLVNKSKTRACDVLVAGGGMAGIAAAIAAGRSGAKTLLVEKNGWLGGQGEERGAVCEAGADTYIAKPVTQEKFIDTVLSLFPPTVYPRRSEQERASDAEDN